MKIKEKIENAGTVRRSHALLDDMGLAAALEWQCREFRKSTGVPCVFTEENFDDIAGQVDKSVAQPYSVYTRKRLPIS
jgi:signal transduction histidine kinase